MRKTRKSSDRQKEIFQFIKAFLLEKGYPPSVREIGEAVGLKSSSTVHGYLSRLEANGMIKRDPTKPRAIDILDERPWRQNVPVPMLMGIHKGAALFSERNIRDVYSFPQDMLGTHKKTYLLHMPDDGLQEAGIAEGDVLFITPQEFANDFDLVGPHTGPLLPPGRGWHLPAAYDWGVRWRRAVQECCHDCRTRDQCLS